MPWAAWRTTTSDGAREIVCASSSKLVIDSRSTSLLPISGLLQSSTGSLVRLLVGLLAGLREGTEREGDARWVSVGEVGRAGSAWAETAATKVLRCL